MRNKRFLTKCKYVHINDNMVTSDKTHSKINCLNVQQKYIIHVVPNLLHVNTKDTIPVFGKIPKHLWNLSRD